MVYFSSYVRWKLATCYDGLHPLSFFDTHFFCALFHGPTQKGKQVFLSMEGKGLCLLPQGRIWIYVNGVRFTPLAPSWVLTWWNAVWRCSGLLGDI